MASLFTGGKFQAINSTGILPGALLYTYAAGTLTPLATYTNQGGLTPNANPVICDTFGQADVWLGTSALRAILKTAAGVTVWDVDNITSAANIADLTTATDVTKGDALLGVKTSLAGSVATTQHQVNDERTSVFQTMTPTQITTIKAESGAAGAICSAAIQTQMDTGGLLSFPVGTYQLDAPLFIKSGTPRVTFLGDSQIRSTFQPNAVTLAALPMSVNALIINQDNNAHFCMENMRMTATNGFTGVGVYCVEGGGTDTTGQALFSAIFRNLWVDFGTTNTGFLTGATQNTVFDTLTFENMKGCFTLQGVGSGDNFYRDISLYNCYDHLILQTADTSGSFASSMSGVHAYGHQRGVLCNVQNWTGGSFNDISFEAATGNLGTTGIFKFKSCISTQASNFYARTRTGVPACAVGIELDTHVGKFTQGAINADIGAKIGGTGAHDIEFVNVDFTNCTTAALQIAAACSGTLRTRGCKFNDSTIHGFVSASASSLNWISDNDEFINAGLGASGAARNILINTSGKVVIRNPRIGQNNVSAAAIYFVEANGSGTVDIYDPIWVGTPPTAYFAGSQTVSVHLTQTTGETVVTAATYTVAATDYRVVGNGSATITLTLPAPAANVGRRLEVQTLTAFTIVSATSNVLPMNGAAAGTGIVAATAGKAAYLESNGTAWRITMAN